jgi:hypothetical protein
MGTLASGKTHVYRWAPEEPNALRGFLDKSAEVVADLR